MSNSDNPRVGTIFQKEVMEWFKANYESGFDMEVKIPIGSWLLDSSQYKDHKFDIVSEDKSIVIECKCYTWTESGNVPSAKMGFINEAAFYLSLVKKARKKIIVMLKSYNQKGATLADYYYKTNKHLLGDVIIAEYDPENKDMHFINEDEVNRIWHKRVNQFASRYLALFGNPDSTENMISESFDDECGELGFQMDCYRSLCDEYGIDNPDNLREFQSVISEVKDVDILGSAVFSKWRNITHWSYGECCLDDDVSAQRF